MKRTTLKLKYANGPVVEWPGYIATEHLAVCRAPIPEWRDGEWVFHPSKYSWEIVHTHTGHFLAAGFLRRKDAARAAQEIEGLIDFEADDLEREARSKQRDVALLVRRYGAHT